MNNIKLIIFDLDGVLIETKHLHYNALNYALGEKYTISWNEHLAKYDGLKTNQKLEMLTKEKGLPIEMHREVWEKKQRKTMELLNDTIPLENISNCIKQLEKAGYKLACCSNSIRKTVLTILSNLKIIQHFDLILSNEDVKNGKPHPEMYWKAVSTMGYLPEETLIVEDSPYGLLAAARSNSHVFRVTNPLEVTYSNLQSKIEKQVATNLRYNKDFSEELNKGFKI
jgi:HAD superfamily hydrolase (TIGR01509 family)